MRIGERIKNEGPKVFHIKPPMIGAGIEIKPVNKPRKPRQRPRYSIGTSSTCRGVKHTKLLSILNPFNRAETRRNKEDGAKTNSSRDAK